MARKESAVAVVEVASTETTEVPNGVVVPNDDEPVPLTLPASFAKGALLILWRGDNVWKDELSDETSTCK